jgi:hypothetical protein
MLISERIKFCRLWLRNQWPVRFTHTHTHTQYGLVSERRRWYVGGEWVTELVGENGEDPVFVDLLQDRIVQHDALVLPEAIEVGL